MQVSDSLGFSPTYREIVNHIGKDSNNACEIIRIWNNRCTQSERYEAVQLMKVAIKRSDFDVAKALIETSHNFEIPQLMSIPVEQESTKCMTIFFEHFYSKNNMKCLIESASTVPFFHSSYSLFYRHISENVNTQVNEVLRVSVLTKIVVDYYHSEDFKESISHLD